MKILADSISTISDLADTLTLTAALTIAVVAFTKGWIVPAGRLTDWQERTKYEQDRADKLQATLESTTTRIESNTVALTSLKETIAVIVRKE